MPGWCIATRQTLANEIGLTRQTVKVLVPKLLKAGFLEKSPNKLLRITIKFHNHLQLK